MGEILQLVHKTLICFLNKQGLTKEKQQPQSTSLQCQSYLHKYVWIFLPPRKKTFSSRTATSQELFQWERPRGQSSFNGEASLVSASALTPFLTYAWSVQNSEKLLGHHFYDEFRQLLGWFFFCFLSSQDKCICVFCSPSLHCSPFSSYTGSPYSRCSLLLIAIDSLNQHMI